MVYSIDYRISSDYLIGSHEFKVQLKLHFQSFLSFSLNMPEHADKSITDS